MPLTTRYGYTDSPTPGSPATAWTTVASTLSSGATSLSVTSSSNFPSSVEFDIVVGLLGGDGTLSNAERMHVTVVSGTTWTVTRTVAVAHASGESIYHELSAEGLKQNPGAMTDSGDMQYLASTGRMARLAAPANGTYAVSWSSGVPSWVAAATGTIGGSIAASQVAFGSAANTISGSAELTWNNTDASLSVGTTDPSVNWGGPLAYKFNVGSNITLPAIESYSVLAFNPTLTIGTAHAPDFTTAIEVIAVVNGSADSQYIAGIDVDWSYEGSGTIGDVNGVTAVPHFNGTGTATNVSGLIAAAPVGATATATNTYGVYVPYYAGATGTVTNTYGLWVGDIAATATGTTNKYYVWADSRGVYRIRDDNTFNSVYQAISALYNPQFTKYTPGAANYERIVQQWESNVATIRTEAGGTGTLRALNLGGSSVTINGAAALYSGGPLGTPSSGTLTNATGLPIASGVSGLGANVATFLATPSSANLASAITDETGSGLLVFGTAPTFASTITIGTASGTTGQALFKGTTSGTVTLSVADAAGTWTMKLPTSAGTNTHFLQTDGSGNTTWAAASGGGLTIGTTTITSGVSGRILYDNGGVLGEMTTTGSGTVVALATSPTITTSLLFGNGQGFLDEAADVIGIARSTNPQTLKVYNTRTDASNGEWFQGAWVSSIFKMQMSKNGTGSVRTVQILNAGGNVSLSIPSTALGVVTVAQGTATSANVNRLLVGENVTATSGTHESLKITDSPNPTATSTMVWQGLKINPTVNYSNGTPGAGSYEAIRLQVTETALPTGTNYLIRASAGAAGTTDKWTLTNGGVVNAVGAETILSGTAIPAGGTAGNGYKFSSTSNFGVFFGSGAPTLAAAKGSLYLRSDGSGTTDRAYVNTDGSTTWTALTTAA